jgi:hypothetical protein
MGRKFGLSWGARLMTLSVVALLLCFGLCNYGTPFLETGTPIQDKLQSGGLLAFVLAVVLFITGAIIMAFGRKSEGQWPMKAPWHDQTGLAKLLAILLTILGIGLGLCGATFLGLGLSEQGVKSVAVAVYMVEAAIVLLSFAGLAIVSVILVVREIVRSIQSKK